MSDKIWLIANILTFVGSAIATVAALFKSKRRVLFFQSVNHVLEIVAQFLTKAFSGMTQEIITLLYSVIILFVKTSKKAPKVAVSVLCLVAGLVLGVYINVSLSGNVWYGYFPIAAAAIYTIFVIVAFFADGNEAKGDLLLKIGLLINVGCWAAYGWFVKLYPILAFNAAAFVFSLISIVRILSSEKRRAALPPSPAENGDRPE